MKNEFLKSFCIILEESLVLFWLLEYAFLQRSEEMAGDILDVVAFFPKAANEGIFNPVSTVIGADDDGSGRGGWF